MSDTSWTLHVPAAPHLSAGTTMNALAPLLHDWLPRQRWFAGKGHRITGFSLRSGTELLPVGGTGRTPGLLHLLVEVEQAAAAQHSGDRPPPRHSDCYQLLLGLTGVLAPHLAHARIGRPESGPLEGLTVYEAMHDPRLAGLLLERLRAPGSLGGLRFRRSAGSAVPAGLTPRFSTAEQSNTSIVYGDSCILKLFRRISPGRNPDLELTLALARQGCSRVPAPAAWFETVRPRGDRGEPTTLGVLQHYLPGALDGWDWGLAAVDTVLGDRRDRSGDEAFTAESFLLGRATAEVHSALARALPGAVLHRPQLEALAAGMAERLDAAAAAVPALVHHRAGLRTAFADLADLGRRGRAVTAQRIHGDLHLGQTLRTEDGWKLIDFEGEPARPLAERRMPQPAVRDVAAMLRSFDYAARWSEMTAEGPPDPGACARAARWAEVNRAAFCAGYAEAGDHDPRDEHVLMRAFETDKAVYEVLYEARNRPSWLPIPLAAGGGGGRPAARRRSGGARARGAP
ncbi:maltokinase, partial [Streptomyces sp. NPDC059506]|uniref:maltokinase N-terminal cap-like domain-containing protein n=1 Tax=Streptomyces sp. NPDC059506 TaxID=3347751 RepID=UPI0036743D7E